jgi:hypothetical protein
MVFGPVGVLRVKGRSSGLTIFVVDEIGIARLNARSSGLAVLGASAGSVPR